MVPWPVPLGFLLAIVIPATAAAQSIRLPLDGYYRPGRCMPVFIEPSDREVNLQGQGSVPTRVEAGRGGVVPVLVLDAQAGPLNGIPLKALSDSQRLIGSAVDDPGIGARVFPSHSALIVRLDPSNPLAGPALAWQGLDAVVLERSLSVEQTSDLLACGVTVVARGAALPDRFWPWRRLDESHWMLRHALAGPELPLSGEVAYLPAESWQPTQPLRWMIFVMAIVIALLMLGASLLPTRRLSIAGMLVVVLACCAMIEFWRRTLPQVRVASGAIAVASDAMVQVDHWDYLRPLDRRMHHYRASRITLPALLDASHAASAGLVLDCARDAESLGWRYRLEAGSTLAFVSRSIASGPGNDIGSTPAGRSPLQELARQAYVGSGRRITGERPWGTKDEFRDHWPAVLIRSDADDAPR